MKFIIFLCFFCICFLNCKVDKETPITIVEKSNKSISKIGDSMENDTLENRINVPEGFERLPVLKGSFQDYLRHLPLKPANSKVLYYNGSEKENDVYEAVVDLPIGTRDLHQCADAVMRLKAEYHWQKQEYNKIHFNFTNGFRVDYTEWIKGRRMIIDGNKTYWNNGNKGSNSYNDFWKYMELIFSYAGTASLSKELKTMEIMEMEIGDVFIKGGFPGHAVIVMDMAINQESGKKLFLLGQSYMPAQELQILKNFENLETSPWYELSENEEILTPEWHFYKSELKRFVD